MTVKKVALRCLGVAIGCVAALLALEAAARIVCRACDPSGGIVLTQLADGTAIGEPNTTARQIKNTRDYDVSVAFNAFGFRDRKSFTPTPPDALFVVGDSFAFGWGVEEPQRFSNRLEGLLGRSVFNIATVGGDFDAYDALIRYAESRGARVGAIVVSVCMENDLGSYSAGGADRRRAILDTPARVGVVARLRAAMLTHSALRFAIARAVHGTPWMKALAIRAGWLVPNGADAAESDVSDSEVAASVDRLRRLIEGRRAVVLVIPSRGLWLGTPEHRQRIADVHAAFVGRLRAAGVAVVDVRSRFEAEGHPLAYHFANDGHWNADGHRIAAEALAENLRAR